MRVQRRVDEMNRGLRKLKEFYEKIREYELKDWLLRKLRSMWSRMKREWKTYNGWFLCIVAAITVFVTLFFISPTTDQDNARYILSAISQGLAAIFALVFTITLVVAQMMRRYTAMDKIMRKRGTTGLMLVFGTGIIIPLLVLKHDFFFGQGVNLSIAITFFCVFSLIPFLRGASRVLMYGVGVGNLQGDIMGAIESGDNVRIINNFKELIEIVKSATKEFREDVVLDIVLILSGIGIKPAGKKLEALTLLFASGMVEFIRIESIKKGFERVLLLALPVSKILDMAATEEMDAKSTVNGLWCFGAFATEYLPEQVDRVIHALKEKEKEVGKDLLVEGERDCISGYPNLKPALEEFKRRYEMCEVE